MRLRFTACSKCQRFNPRPPLLAGDDQVARQRGVQLAFQSAPAIAGGRCKLGKTANLVTGVSIRARHCWRAMAAILGATEVASVFQSAPAIAGGRCAWRCSEHTSQVGFNPRPPLLAGDGVAPAGAGCWVRFQSAPAIAGGRWSCAILTTWCAPVSIRARHCWRAMPRLATHSTGALSFQSAPAIAGGRCRGAGAGAPDLPVSIRARHCWRAMPVAPVLAVRCKACFNPRPPLLAGDAGLSWSDPARTWFQSAPAIAGGR